MKTEDDGSRVDFVCFQGVQRISEGDLSAVALAAHKATDGDPETALLVFDRETGKVIDLNLSGTEADISARYAPTVAEVAQPEIAKRGRPKLGVISREVTLLPRHWDWLSAQPGGASVTIRKLIEVARKAESATGDIRARTNTAYQFMRVLAGDMPGFEEASRALFAGDMAGLAAHMANWPSDVRDEVLRCFSE